MSDTKDQLIESTQQLLWERGYAATSPKAILERSGAGQGSMYHHFGGKEELAHAALERTAMDVRQKAARAVGVDGSPIDRLITYLTQQREVLRGCPVGRMVSDPEVLERPALHGLVSSTFADLRAQMTKIADEAVRIGELRPDVRPDELAETVLAVVQGGYVLARASGDHAPFDAAVRGAVALLEIARQRDDKESA